MSSFFKPMKRFSDIFFYEHSNFDGVYYNCKLIRDTSKTFPVIVVDTSTQEIYFYDEDVRLSFVITFKGYM